MPDFRLYLAIIHTLDTAPRYPGRYIGDGTLHCHVRFVVISGPICRYYLKIRFRPFPDARRKKKTPQKAASSVRDSGYAPALFAARLAGLLLGRHPLNHLRGIVTFRVEFEGNPIVADGRLVVALGHDGLSEGIPCVGR